MTKCLDWIVDSCRDADVVATWMLHLPRTESTAPPFTTSVLNLTGSSRSLA